MIKKPRVIVLACLLAVSGTAASSAHGYSQSGLEQAAYAFWGGRIMAACPTGIETVKQAPYQDDAQADAAGWARPGVCDVHLSVYRDFAGRWVSDCATYLHEVGHIVGYGHDFTGYGHIMDGEPMIVRSTGLERRRHRWRRVVVWTGVGTYWCRRYAREHFARGPARRSAAAAAA